MRTLSSCLLVSLLLFLLTGCGGGSQPALIAAQPRTGEAPAAQGGVEVIQTIWIELAVTDLNATAGRANELAAAHSGFQQEARAWSEGQGSRLMLIYTIPTRQVEGARRAFLSLGQLLDESISNRVVPVAPGAAEGQSFSTITLLLHSSAPAAAPPPAPAPALPALPSLSTLRPARTFQSAFGVFAALALFILDILIWLVVVGGPFALIGLGIRALVRRYELRDGQLVRREVPLALPEENVKRKT